MLARMDAARRRTRRDYAIRDLDILAAAWGWTVDEQAAVLRHTPDQLDRHREFAEPASEVLVGWLDDLQRLQNNLAATCRFDDYRGWWRRPWQKASELGGRSPIEAVTRDGMEGVATLNGWFDSLLSGDFR